MRADLIQIGDYFAYPTQTINDGNLKIGRVNFIRHDGIVQVDFVDTNAQLLEPIELTPSILEKNGMKPFEVDKQRAATAKWWHKGGDFYVKQYHFKHHNFKPTYSFGCNNHTLIEGIEYVHQLQHALKLCGIGIEIIL